MMTTFLLLLFGICTFYLANGQCSISYSDIKNTNGVVTYTDIEGNIQLVRSPIVPVGSSLAIFCNGNEPHWRTCREDNNFEPAFPVHCEVDALTTVKVIEDPACPAPAIMYQIGHNILNLFLELYRTCYDPKNVRAYYSEAYIYRKHVFPLRPCSNFTTDNIATPNQISSYDRKHIYNKFQMTYGFDEEYISNDMELVISRGQLTPSADFLFGDQMCGALKYINVVPQFTTIVDGNWQIIERWIRNHIPINSLLNVRTGAIGILALPKNNNDLIEVYLQWQNKNPIPKWIYKIVYDVNIQKPINVFLTYNNIFAKEFPKSPDFCQAVDCPVTLVKTASAGYTLCCDPEHFA